MNWDMISCVSGGSKFCPSQHHDVGSEIGIEYLNHVSDRRAYMWCSESDEWFNPTLVVYRWKVFFVELLVCSSHELDEQSDCIAPLGVSYEVNRVACVPSPPRLDVPISHSWFRLWDLIIAVLFRVDISIVYASVAGRFGRQIENTAICGSVTSSICASIEDTCPDVSWA